MACQAQDNEQTNDSISVTSLDDIINTESRLFSDRDDIQHYQTIWNKNAYIKLGYNSTTFSSSEFPSLNGPYSEEQNSDWGLGFQYGSVFNFHKNPLGDVVFIGLDYTGINLNVNRFNGCTPSPTFESSPTKPYHLPWHNKIWMVDYSMLLGPAVTLYPFTSLRKSGTDNIRLEIYFQMGYNVALAIINDVPNNNMNETKNKLAFGHGFCTNFGFNVTWDFVGIGYESQITSSMNFNATDDDYDTGSFNAKKSNGRFYIQFRF